MKFLKSHFSMGNTLHSILKPTKSMPKTYKRKMAREVDEFLKPSSDFQDGERFARQLGRSVHAVSHAPVFPGTKIVTSSLEGFTIWPIGILSFAFHNACDHMFHVMALYEAKHLVRTLKRKGIKNPQHFKYAVENLMMKRGGLLYSSLSVARGSKTITQLAKGKNLSFKKGPVYKFYKNVYMKKVARPLPSSKMKNSSQKLSTRDKLLESIKQKMHNNRIVEWLDRNLP